MVKRLGLWALAGSFRHFLRFEVSHLSQIVEPTGFYFLGPIVLPRLQQFSLLVDFAVFGYLFNLTVETFLVVFRLNYRSEAC